MSEVKLEQLKEPICVSMCADGMSEALRCAAAAAVIVGSVPLLLPTLAPSLHVKLERGPGQDMGRAASWHVDFQAMRSGSLDFTGLSLQWCMRADASRKTAWELLASRTLGAPGTLYYTVQEGRLLFANDLRALLDQLHHKHLTPEPRMAWSLLCHGLLLAPLTPYAQIRQLPAGGQLRCWAGTVLLETTDSALIPPGLLDQRSELSSAGGGTVPLCTSVVMPSPELLQAEVLARFAWCTHVLGEPLGHSLLPMYAVMCEANAAKGDGAMPMAALVEIMAERMEQQQGERRALLRRISKHAWWRSQSKDASEDLAGETLRAELARQALAIQRHATRHLHAMQAQGRALPLRGQSVVPAEWLGGWVGFSRNLPEMESPLSLAVRTYYASECIAGTPIRRALTLFPPFLASRVPARQAALLDELAASVLSMNHWSRSLP